MMWIWIGLGGAFLLALLLRQLPIWLHAVLLSTALLLTVGLSMLHDDGLSRTLAPALLCAVGLGVLMPTGTSPAQRVSKRKGAKSKEKDIRRPSKTVIGKGPEAEDVKVPGYDVLEKVGSGGMASVYKARRKNDHKIIALKIPMEQYVADAKFIKRFHREAEVALRLKHQSIVRTFEHGSKGVKHFMAMEYLDGRGLDDYITRNELTPEISVGVMQAVADALTYIHDNDIIHRDIKPANIMILKDAVQVGQVPAVKPDGVKLMDFGIAGGKMLAKLTMAGARLGTPVYMSPEQARGLKLDNRSDIYSLGLVFYEMLTGQTAFKGTYENIVHQQIFQNPPPPQQLNFQIPKQLNDLVMWMIAKDPDGRPSLEQVQGVLERFPFTGEYSTIEAEPPSSLQLVLNHAQGMVRLMDTEGNLRLTMGNVGTASNQFIAPPQSVAMDELGQIYAIILEHSTVDGGPMIHHVTAQGERITTFGRYGMKASEFLHPVSLALGPSCLYVLDKETHLVQCFDRQGNYLSQFGGAGPGQGTFSDPRMISVSWGGQVYVLDYGNRQVQCFTPDGKYQTRWAFRVSKFDNSMRVIDGFTTDPWGNLYISDAHDNKVRKISSEGKIIGAYDSSDSGAALPNDMPTGELPLLDMGVDHQGYLYTIRRGSHAIRKYDMSGLLISTIDTYSPVKHMMVRIKPTS